MQFKNDPKVRQEKLAEQTKEKTLSSMKQTVTANLKPHINVSSTEKLDTEKRLRCKLQVK